MNRSTMLSALLIVAAIGCKREKAPPAADTTAMAPTPVDTTPPAPKLDDATIVGIFDSANTFDIEASQLALQKSHNADVKKLATQFMNDHKAVRQQGRDLAKKLNVTPTPPATSPLGQQHAAAMTDLQSKSGADFDKAFAANEVKYHQTVIDAVQTTLLPAIQNAELKAFVQKVAPAFQAHLQAAQALQTKLGS
jgi:putative membrane protein